MEQGGCRAGGRGGGETGRVRLSQPGGLDAVPTSVLSVVAEAAGGVSAWGHGVMGCPRKMAGSVWESGRALQQRSGGVWLQQEGFGLNLEN